jgi:hypothetical protein
VKKKRKAKRIQRKFYQSDHDKNVFLRKPGKLKNLWKWRMWIRGMGLVATYYGRSQRDGENDFDVAHDHFIGRLGSKGEFLVEKP